MDNIAWILWTILGLGLIIAEIFTLGFVLFWFGIGAIAAALMAYLGFGIGIQFFVFAGVSIILTVLSRTIFAKYYSHGEEHKVLTGIDSLPGQIGTVTAESKGTLGAGEVKVYGSTWRALPDEGEDNLAEGEKVEVVRVEGASIYVRKVKELAGWNDGD